MKVVWCVSIVAFTLGSLLVAAQPWTPPKAPRWSATRHPRGWSYNGEARKYHVIAPPVSQLNINISSNETGYGNDVNGHPVIIMFHGSGGDAAAFAVQTPVLTRAATEQGYFLVFPEGIPKTGSSMRCRERTWNSGTCCGEAYIKNVDDTGFIKAVIHDLFEHYAGQIDKDQLFVTGSSNGGSMALRIGCELADLVRAAAPQIGSLEARDGSSCGYKCYHDPGDTYRHCGWDGAKPDCAEATFMHRLPELFSCKKLKTHPVPMLLFNGDLDTLSNVSGSVEVPLDKNDTSVKPEAFPPMTYATSALREATGCDPEARATVSFRNGTKGNMTVCTTWAGGASCAHTNFTYCLSDAGHRWYGSTYDFYGVCRWEGYDAADCNPAEDIALYGPNTLSISVADQIIEFFAVQGSSRAGT
eukprot:m.172484 g.172484  ORF g.172484 m.172484 type:complete len:415 (+) comp18287_c0_seq2:49-1293(+)